MVPQDPLKPATVDNLVLLTHAEADEHDQLQSLDALRQQVRAAPTPLSFSSLSARLAVAHLQAGWWAGTAGRSRHARLRAVGAGLGSGALCAPACFGMEKWGARGAVLLRVLPRTPIVEPG